MADCIYRAGGKALLEELCKLRDWKENEAVVTCGHGLPAKCEFSGQYFWDCPNILSNSLEVPSFGMSFHYVAITSIMLLLHFYPEGYQGLIL